MDRKVIEAWKASLPTVLIRAHWNDYKEKYGLPYSRGYMAQLDSKNEGPEKQIICSKVCYLRDDYLKWLESRIMTDQDNSATRSPSKPSNIETPPTEKSKFTRRDQSNSELNTEPCSQPKTAKSKIRRRRRKDLNSK
jgi:hypothetical protein